MIDQSDTLAFIGWLRPKGKSWYAVVQAESEDAAWRLLLAHDEGGDKCVLATGKHPNDRPARRRLTTADKRGLYDHDRTRTETCPTG
jgi:hypothetical protein